MANLSKSVNLDGADAATQVSGIGLAIYGKAFCTD
jgi:hypothetical protein